MDLQCANILLENSSSLKKKHGGSRGVFSTKRLSCSISAARRFVATSAACSRLNAPATTASICLTWQVAELFIRLPQRWAVHPPPNTNIQFWKSNLTFKSSWSGHLSVWYLWAPKKLVCISPRVKRTSDWIEVVLWQWNPGNALSTETIQLFLYCVRHIPSQVQRQAMKQTLHYRQEMNSRDCQEWDANLHLLNLSPQDFHIPRSILIDDSLL